ncbi:protease HtpX [Leucothrix arctica]|uniref:Protease HtpX n=1 Tax=Leucothrix arctica TaxID=1481894 RepID=A0A317CB93_9GAMM|nr:protease HtpX [Leucothrix arctica]PWQ95904.1 protease HtpX [Leucothrix arctica]
MKRTLLLMATNFAIVAVLGVVWNILDSMFGISQALRGMGLPAEFGYIALMSLVMGFAGAFISLAMSKSSAKRSMGVHVIEHPTNQQEQWLFNIVAKQAEKSGIDMPEVGIFDSPEVNAFATGARRNSALVAVSTGLLNTMNADEVEAVLGHEIAHVANGDMVTQTLLQGVLNTFVFFFARVIATLVNSLLSGNNNNGNRGNSYGMVYYITSMVAQMALGFLANIVVMWFSRYREFQADKGGADLAGRQKMIDALKVLQRGSSPHDLPGQLKAFGISGGLSGGMKKLFMTHPPLEERIAALEAQR